MIKLISVLNAIINRLGENTQFVMLSPWKHKFNLPFVVRNCLSRPVRSRILQLTQDNSGVGILTLLLYFGTTLIKHISTVYQFTIYSNLKLTPCFSIVISKCPSKSFAKFSRFLQTGNKS